DAVARAAARDCPRGAARPRPAEADRGTGTPRGARQDLADRAVGGGRARCRVLPDQPARPAKPLGLVLEPRQPELQLASRARAARRARLRRGARGLSSRRAAPRPGLLEPRRTAAAALRRVEALARRSRVGDPRPRAPPRRRP